MLYTVENIVFCII